MKILITGANGYIGKTLVNKLKEDHEIVPLTRDIVDLTNSNQVNSFFQQKRGSGKLFDWIIHTATKGGSRLLNEDCSILFDNLKMHYNLLRNRNLYGRFISFGSGAEILAQNTPYGFSKMAIADSMMEKSGHYNIRIYGLFDENELPTRFIKGNITRYINKEPMQIYENKIMDFFFMEDLISLVKYYLNNNNLPKEIDCSYKEKYYLKDIAEIINNLSDYKVSISSCNNNSINYTGKFNLPIPYLGLEHGIRSVYNILSKL